ncbi:MAG: hypothetical protein ACFFDF_07735 [Candidatus Odinarchaeota archaeon]
MKHGRILKLKSEHLKKIRTNLRRLWLTVLDDLFNRTLDQGYLQDSMDNFIGVQKINQSLRSMDFLFQFSICRCWRCRSVEKDAVFWSDEIEDQFAYPPYNENETIEHPPETYFWVCPECFKWMMQNVESRKKEQYYYFREYGIKATLHELGIDRPQDIDKFMEEENKFFEDMDFRKDE